MNEEIINRTRSVSEFRQDSERHEVKGTVPSSHPVQHMLVEEANVGRKVKREGKKGNSKLSTSNMATAITSKLLRISISLHQQLKAKSKANNLPMSALAEQYLSQGLLGRRETLDYFIEKYGNKKNKDEEERW